MSLRSVAAPLSDLSQLDVTFNLTNIPLLPGYRLSLGDAYHHGKYGEMCRNNKLALKTYCNKWIVVEGYISYMTLPISYVKSTMLICKNQICKQKEIFSTESNNQSFVFCSSCKSLMVEYIPYQQTSSYRVFGLNGSFLNLNKQCDLATFENVDDNTKFNFNNACIEYPIDLYVGESILNMVSSSNLLG